PELHQTHKVEESLFGPRFSAPRNLANINGVLMFAGLIDDRPPAPPTEQLFFTLGDAQHTFMRLLGSFTSSSPAQFVSAGGRVYFAADDGQSGRELWTLDNQQPTAQAGDDQTVEDGASINVFGSGQDPDGFPIPSPVFEWRNSDGRIVGRNSQA